MDKTQEIKDKYKSLGYKMAFKKALAKKLNLTIKTIETNFFKKWEISLKHQPYVLKMLDSQISYENKINNISVKHYEQL